jgi:WD40 repeat protein/uncharacterized caspase-like protein
MKLSTPPIRWFSIALLALTAAALALVVGLDLRRLTRRPLPDPPRAGPSPDSRAGEPSPSPHADPPQSPQVWVIAIGIDQYQDDAIPPSRGARDARAVAQWFAKTAGWNRDNVLLLDDSGDVDPGLAGAEPVDLLPTRANLGWAFRTWLAGRVHDDDVIVVFFAGHAVGLPAQEAGDAEAVHPARGVLLPIDARYSQCERTGWRLDEALDHWASTGRNPIVCWLDTSLHGRGRRLPPADGTGAGPGTPPAGPSLLPGLVRWPGVTAWLAAEGRPTEEPKMAGALSPFTAAICAGLGTPARPVNLLGCLDAVLKDPTLREQGFRMLGGIDPNLGLWAAHTRHRGLAERKLILQRGHAGGITAIAHTTDGARLITAAQDSTIKVWRVADRSVLQADSAHLVGVTCLDVSADGRWLASGDGSGQLRLRDLVRDAEVPTGPVHESGVESLAFLGDGEHLVSIDRNGASWLWPIAGPASGVTQLSAQSTGLTAARGPDAMGFARAETDGKVRLHAHGGAPAKTVDGPGGVVTSRRLAMDDRVLAAADDEGRLIVRDAGSGTVLFAARMDAPVETVALDSGRWLAVAAGPRLALVTLNAKPPEIRVRLELPDSANQLLFSSSGRWLAASTQAGRVCLWELTEEGRAEPLALENAAETDRTTTLAFGPDGRSLVSGDQDGGLRTWDLPRGRQRPRVLPRRGQIAGLSVSADGRYLLQISQDWQAQVWDLQEGRGLALVPGLWTAGALAPDGARMYLTDAQSGNVVAVDRTSGRILPVSFERPHAQGGPGFSTQQFARVTVARDGRWIAAGSSLGPLACVWDAATGRLVQTLRGHRAPSPITAVEFSADAQRILTASEDGTARLWDLSQPDRAARELAKYTLTDAPGGEAVPVAAATLAWAPDRPVRVAAGGLNGQVVLWEGEEGGLRTQTLGRMDYPILAAAFTPDGHWLAVTSADKSVWLWDLAGPPRRVRLQPLPNHDEQINALLAWPGSRLIVTGSDDTTIRFWSLEKSVLLGTLSAEQGTLDWVAYTPDGLFDSSIGGERQVSWHDDQGALSLEQVREHFHVYKLADQLRRGEPPLAPKRPVRTPPRLAIDAPAEPVQADRLARLSISLSEPGLTGLRLYQNGVPVQSDPDFQREPAQQRVTTQVRLRPGLNRFYAMAGRAGRAELEGRSDVVEVRYDGAEPAGRLHVLALGVSEYAPEEWALRFADQDALGLADFLTKRSARAAAPGLTIVLKNREVTGPAIDEAFIALREQVREHPEDTVVIFMAGHADMINGRFVLLLPTFRFRPGPARGPVDPDTVLPYVDLYRNIARLGALRRLVVIDACRADAVADDPGVRQIQALVDDRAQRARTAYLLADRRGEPAGEAGALEHGLLTYALLRGLGDGGLKSVPGLALFDTLPNADRNHDRVVTTEELRWYVDATVPALAAQLPSLVLRKGIDGQAAPAAAGGVAGPSPRIQAAETSFPLVELP